MRAGSCIRRNRRPLISVAWTLFAMTSVCPALAQPPAPAPQPTQSAVPIIPADPPTQSQVFPDGGFPPGPPAPEGGIPASAAQKKPTVMDGTIPPPPADYARPGVVP